MKRGEQSLWKRLQTTIREKEERERMTEVWKTMEWKAEMEGKKESQEERCPMGHERRRAERNSRCMRVWRSLITQAFEEMSPASPPSKSKDMCVCVCVCMHDCDCIQRSSRGLSIQRCHSRTKDSISFNMKVLPKTQQCHASYSTPRVFQTPNSWVC